MLHHIPPATPPTHIRPLTMPSSIINVENAARSGSSVFEWQGECTTHNQPKLNSSLGVTFASTGNSIWHKMDLQKPHSVDGIVMQGRAKRGGHVEQRVTSVEIYTSLHPHGDRDYVSHGVYKANQDATPDKQVEIKLRSGPVSAQWVKVVVLEFHAHPTMRVAVLGSPTPIVVKTALADGTMRLATIGFDVTYENLMTWHIKPAYPAGVHALTWVDEDGDTIKIDTDVDWYHCKQVALQAAVAAGTTSRVVVRLRVG